MNLKKMIFGLLILGTIPSAAFAGAAASRGDFKELPADCKGLKEATYVHYLDHALAERSRLAKEVSAEISSAAPSPAKQQACQRYLRSIQNVASSLDQNLKPARLPTGSASLIGGVAVVNGMKNLEPSCYDGMKKKEAELNRKEANFRQLCK